MDLRSCGKTRLALANRLVVVPCRAATGTARRLRTSRVVLRCDTCTLPCSDESGVTVRSLRTPRSGLPGTGSCYRTNGLRLPRPCWLSSKWYRVWKLYCVFIWWWLTAFCWLIFAVAAVFDQWAASTSPTEWRRRRRAASFPSPHWDDDTATSATGGGALLLHDDLIPYAARSDFYWRWSTFGLYSSVDRFIRWRTRWHELNIFDRPASFTAIDDVAFDNTCCGDTTNRWLNSASVLHRPAFSASLLFVTTATTTFGDLIMLEGTFHLASQAARGDAYPCGGGWRAAICFALFSSHWLGIYSDVRHHSVCW